MADYSSTTKTKAPQTLVAVFLAILSYIVIGLLSVAPVVAAAHWLGAWNAFLLMGVLYGVGSYVISIWLLRIYDRNLQKPSRMARWLDEQEHDAVSGRVLIWLKRSMWIAFIPSCFVLGAIATTLLIRHAGRKDGIQTLAIAAAIVFGVVYVGFYTGLGRLVFG